MGAGASRQQAPGAGPKRVCIVGGGVAGGRILAWLELHGRMRRQCAAAAAHQAQSAAHAQHSRCPPARLHRRNKPGMACAWSLSRFPERFAVEVWEALPEVGGVASTCAIDGGAPPARAGLRRVLGGTAEAADNSAPAFGGALELSAALRGSCELCTGCLAQRAAALLHCRNPPTPSPLPASPPRRRDQRPGAGRRPQLPQQPALLQGGRQSRGARGQQGASAGGTRGAAPGQPAHQPAAPPATHPQEFGFEPHEVQLRIAFGTGDCAWTNHRRARGWQRGRSGDGSQLRVGSGRCRRRLPLLLPASSPRLPPPLTPFRSLPHRPPPAATARW